MLSAFYKVIVNHFHVAGIIACTQFDPNICFLAHPTFHSTKKGMSLMEIGLTIDGFICGQFSKALNARFGFNEKPVKPKFKAGCNCKEAGDFGSVCCCAFT